MRVRWSEKPLYLNALIDLLSKACKFTSIHLFAHKLPQTPSGARLPGRAVENGDDHFIPFLLNLGFLRGLRGAAGRVGPWQTFDSMGYHEKWGLAFSLRIPILGSNPTPESTLGFGFIP